MKTTELIFRNYSISGVISRSASIQGTEVVNIARKEPSWSMSSNKSFDYFIYNFQFV